MANFDIIMPKMGESIEEATITNWFVKEGDMVEEDDVLLEIATDKVDSEIPSPVEGVIKKIFFRQDEVVAVGTVIAVIGLDGDDSSSPDEKPEAVIEEEVSDSEPEVIHEKKNDEPVVSSQGRFYSPLVRTIAGKEGVSQDELDAIEGSGLNGRVRKEDLLKYLENRGGALPVQTEKAVAAAPGSAPPAKKESAPASTMEEVDVSAVVEWRNRAKEDFLKKEGVKLTYLPVFLEATVKALRDFPQINASVDGDKIILKKNINLGIAVSLPDNNLIVPNIKDAGALNLTGLTKKMNALASAARSNKLNPDDISGGTFTVTNFGSFQNDIGTPIINQPEVAILAIGAIKKKPAVIETEMGDMIAIRQKMWLSLTYDHRIVDGALGGAFLKRLGDYIESFDPHAGNFKL
ncbi:MAG: 2-oxo acid dehydrogenase subunit E2 [Deltaproteobacteria bacterium]|nr:2-oxo acid dehydrogenase subunit E2 [Deltaproteobacteria bacterium]